MGKGSFAKLPAPAIREGLLPIYKAVAFYISAVDDPGIELLLRTCRSVAADCTVDEICHFIHAKGPQTQNKDSPMGFLITAVANCFRGESFQQFRANRTRKASRETIGATVFPSLPPVPPEILKLRDQLFKSERDGRAAEKEVYSIQREHSPSTISLERAQRKLVACQERIATLKDELQTLGYPAEK
jgi:hypothetical protein